MIMGGFMWLQPLSQSMGDVSDFVVLLFFEVSWSYLVCCSLVVFNLKTKKSQVFIGMAPLRTRSLSISDTR